MLVDQIYNENCLVGMAKIPDDSIDLIVTDPPYLINYKTAYRKDKSHASCSAIANDNNPRIIKDYIKECHRILKDDSAMYLFCNCDKVDFFKAEVEKYFNVKNIIIWVKNNHTAGDLTAQFGKKYEMIILANKGRCKFNGKRLTDVWHFDRVDWNHQLHQNQKPLDMIAQCIVKHSQPNDIIFDGFMGSGTTAVAAINTGRHYIGFELVKDYFNIAQKRINNAIKNKET